MNLVDKYVVYDDVNYIKGGWINRNNILINGQPNLITMHLKAISQNKLINEIEVGDTEKDVKKFLSSIRNAYAKAPYFERAFPLIQEIVTQSESVLSLYLYNSLKLICRYLDIDTELMLSSEIEKDNSLKAEEKILDICCRLNATDYYNAIGGQELYHSDKFESQGMKLHFLKPDGDIQYKQFKNEFVPNLSIIDVMMFNSVEEIHELLNKYTLI